jgi:hypothetical protein
MLTITVPYVNYLCLDNCKAALISKNMISQYRRAASNSEIIWLAWVIAGMILLAEVIVTIYAPTLLLGFLLLSYSATTQRFCFLLQTGHDWISTDQR